MKFKVTGPDRATGQYKSYLIHASDQESASAKASAAGVLVENVRAVREPLAYEAAQPAIVEIMVLWSKVVSAAEWVLFGFFIILGVVFLGGGVHTVTSEPPYEKDGAPIMMTCAVAAAVVWMLAVLIRVNANVRKNRRS